MNEKLRELAEARKKALEAKSAKVLLEMKLRESQEWQVADDQLTYYTAVAGELADEIKAQALEHYLATGEKKMPGVTVKYFTTIEYDEATVMEWAAQKLPDAIVTTLDRKMFEDYARANHLKRPIPGVKIGEEPRAQIATDLSQFLQEEPHE